MNLSRDHRILFWATGGMPTMLDVEGALAVALRHRGASIHAVICDGSYRGCILRSAALQTPVATWGEAGSSEPGWSCSECRDTCSSRLERLGVPHSFIADHLQLDEAKALRRSTQGITWSNLGGLTLDSLPIGKNAQSSVYRYLKGADVAGHEDAIREYACSALLSASAAKRSMERFSPTRVVMSHGVYVDWGPALQVAFSRGIPVFAWMASYQTARFYFRNIEDPARVDLHNLNQSAWQSITAGKLSPAQDFRLNSYLEKRYRQNVAFDLKEMTPFRGSTAEVRKRYALSQDRPIWGILCHINWDAVADASPMAYATLDEWLADTISHAVDTPNVQWIVKVHPAEAWLNTTHGVERLIRCRFPRLPAHVQVMPAREKISPMDFMNLVDGGVTAYGTGGLELALLGKPVILAGEAHYGRKGFTQDGLDRSDYGRLLRRAEYLRPLDSEQISRARAYAYTYFIARQIPFPVVFTEQSSWWEFQPERAQWLEPRKDPFAEFICSKIINGGELIMPENLVEVAELGGWMKELPSSAGTPTPAQIRQHERAPSELLGRPGGATLSASAENDPTDPVFFDDLEAACLQIEDLIRTGKGPDVVHLVDALQQIKLPRGFGEIVASRTGRLLELLQQSLKQSNPGEASRQRHGNRPYAGVTRQIGFIVGTGRCGTTILASVLNAHTKICAPPELSFITQCYGHDLLFEKCLSGEMARFTSNDFFQLITEFCPFDLQPFVDIRRHFDGLDYPQTSVRQVVLDLFDDICFTNGKEILLEQTPWYALELHCLKKLFPEMKVIHMVRDGRDVAISAHRTGWWNMGVGENLERWAHEVNTVRRFAQDHPRGYIEIRYEDLMTHPERELKKILGVFGLTLQPSMMDPAGLVDYFSLNKTAKAGCYSDAYHQWKRKPGSVFFTDSVYAWKKGSLDDFANRSELVKQALLSCGYEA